jgi:hypothetical protein
MRNPGVCVDQLAGSSVRSKVSTRWSERVARTWKARRSSCSTTGAMVLFAIFGSTPSGTGTAPIRSARYDFAIRRVAGGTVVISGVTRLFAEEVEHAIADATHDRADRLVVG